MPPCILAVHPFSDQFNIPRSRHDRISIPTIWVAFVLSLLLHSFALLGRLPLMLHRPFEDPREGKAEGSLHVRLAPPPSPSAASSEPAGKSAAALRAQEAQTRKRARSNAQRRALATHAPEVLAMQGQAPTLAQPSIPAAPDKPTPAPAPAYADLTAMLEARRRARTPASAQTDQGAPAPPVETEQERHNRVVAESLGLTRTPGFGADRKPGGGIFQITTMNYYDAQFAFFGWNKDIKRNSQQLIEVRRGTDASIEIAVVRRMIVIIRENTGGDFVWESPRLGRNVTLSARSEDNAGLEDFMMREFFPQARGRP